jgi:hypothetical protein
MLRTGRDQQLKALAGVELQTDGALIRQHDPLDARPEQPIDSVAQTGES